MKIDIKDYDLVITTKKGVTNLYLNGKEVQGVQEMKYYVCINNLPILTIEKIVDNDGKYYIVGKEVNKKDV